LGDYVQAECEIGGAKRIVVSAGSTKVQKHFCSGILLLWNTMVQLRFCSVMLLFCYTSVLGHFQTFALGHSCSGTFWFWDTLVLRHFCSGTLILSKTGHTGILFELAPELQSLQELGLLIACGGVEVQRCGGAESLG